MRHAQRLTSEPAVSSVRGSSSCILGELKSQKKCERAIYRRLRRLRFHSGPSSFHHLGHEATSGRRSEFKDRELT